MDSWVPALRLLVVMTAIALFYILGGWFAAVLHVLALLQKGPSVWHVFS